MPLTETAAKYLATLDRLPHVSATTVEELLRDAGQPCFEPWIVFHDQFAGYVERIGRDVAVWGIIHEKPQWLAPFEADIETEKDGTTFYVTCADVHPSYGYQLDNKGEFLGFPAENFSIHVERSAAGWAFKSGFNTEALRQAELRDPAFLEQLARASVIESASDRFFQYLRDDDILVIWARGAEFPQRGWRRAAS